jgi:serine protease Do
MKGVFKLLIVLTIVILVGWTSVYYAQDAKKPATGNVIQSQQGTEALQKPDLSSIRTAKQLSQAFVQVSKRVTPSIVMIVNEEKLQNTIGDGAYNQMFPDDLFRRFFDFTPQQREQVQKTLGSGVVVSSDGYIVTNNHVVDNSTKLQVTLSDGRRVPAKIIGRDPKSDLALIQVQEKNLKPITFGNYQNVEVGEWVLAIGSPFGEALQHTVTAGIISAKGRSNMGIADYEDFLQTDAAVNPGNSGGALVDLDGNLIGINTAIVSNTGSNSGVGFAIPVSIVTNVMDQLRTHGRVIRGFLGVVVQNVSPEMQKTLNLPTGNGAIISQVEKRSPAEKAGLRTYDVIVSIDGKPVRDNAELRNVVANLNPGSKATLEILRDGKTHKIQVQVKEVAGDRTARESSSKTTPNLGMDLQDLTPDLAQQLSTERKYGVVVTRVYPGSRAEEAGLQEGDVLFEVNRKEIRSVDQFQDMIRQNTDSSVLLAVERQHTALFISLQTG